MSNIQLRPVQADDLPALFEFQNDPLANDLAAVHPRSWDDFLAHWQAVLQDDEVCSRTVLADGAIAGNVSLFPVGADVFTGYWIHRALWGQGIATAALRMLLQEDARRPVHARVAAHNAASICVLQKCGFAITGREASPETERFRACEEVWLTLASPQRGQV